MTISGTPTAAGTFPLTITAWDGSNGSGSDSAKIKVNVTVTGGVANVAPGITTQPASITVIAGGPASFTVAASGTPTPTLQWQKGGVDIVGATSGTYSIASALAGDAGSYTAVATNAAGSATSSAATLTINAAATAPSITSQPTSVTVTAGGSATFTVAASGSPTPTYQWQKGGVAIAGATSATYSIASVVTGDAGNYTAVASNSAGSATSAAATLTVSAATSAPAITTQPTTQTMALGSSATFTVSASGNPAPTYQWKKGTVAIAGATSATYSIASVVAGDAGSYTAVASNSAGNATTAAATLTVSAATNAPTITTQPTSQTVAPGASATFTVAASGNPTPTYQWKKGAVTIAGATSATYAIASTVAGDAGNYTAVATNSAGSATSSAATLTIQSSSAVTLISSQLVVAGHDVAISATGASGTTQWQVSSDNGVTWQNLTDSSTDSGTTSSTLEILKVTSTLNNNQYRCQVSGSASSATALNVIQGYFTFPTAVVADGSGGRYVSDAVAQTIQKISPANLVTLIAGLTGQIGSADGLGSAARFKEPGALVAASDGTLTVSDTENDLIRSVTGLGSVTVLAGSAGSVGSIDGTGSSARFSTPIGIARDASGVLFVADFLNHTIRRVTASGFVTTFAGSAGIAGAADGTGSDARFNHPTGVAVDISGNIYVSDAANHTIRKISPAGLVTTVAGLAGVNGTGSAARFQNPGGLAIDPSGDLFVADTGNSTIRKVSATGIVTTIAGLPGVSGLMDGIGGYAWFDQPEGLTQGTDGNLYVVSARKRAEGGCSE